MLLRSGPQTKGQNNEREKFMNQDIQNQLTQIAFKKSKPFCYSCYEVVLTESGHCPTCGSDDNMRLLEGVGVEYGCDWIIEQILKENLTPVDLDEAYEQFMAEVYPETTKVGYMELDTVRLMKEMDPIGWSCGQSDWESQEASDGEIITLDNGSTYYRRYELEDFIEKES